MKILALEYGDSEMILADSIACYPDSTLIRNNDDFYIPNFSHRIIATVGVYLHCSKIGKCVEPRFVSRYFTEMGVAVKFMAADVMDANFPHGTKTDRARGFDSSLAISNEVISVDGSYESMQLVCSYNNKLMDIYPDSLYEQLVRLPMIIAEATKYYTLKIGDLFYLPYACQPIYVQKDDVFDLSLQGKQLLTCTIK